MAKRKYQWTGGGQIIEPEPDASTSVGEVIRVVPALSPSADAGADTQCVVEAIYMHFSVHRLLITELDALGFLVWTANVAESGSDPSQALDALSTTDRAYANKNILMMAPLAVPRIGLSADLLSATVTEEVLVSSHEFQASRKLDRSNQVLAMTVNSDVSVVVSVFCQWRVLLSYGAR